MSEKKKIKINVVDAFVVVVIVAILAFVAFSFVGKNVVKNSSDQGSSTASESSKNKDEEYILTFYVEEAPDFAADNIKVKGLATDNAKSIPLGKIIKVEKAPSVVYTVDAQGNSVKTSKEGYSSLTIKTEIEANEFEHGISVWGVHYVVGTSMTLYADDAIVYGRLSGIEKKPASKAKKSSGTKTSDKSAEKAQSSSN